MTEYNASFGPRSRTMNYTDAMGGRRQVVIPQFGPSPRQRYGNVQGTGAFFDFHTTGSELRKSKLEGLALGVGGGILLGVLAGYWLGKR